MVEVARLGGILGQPRPASGTKLPFRDVRHLVAMGCKLDMALTANSVEIDRFGHSD